MRTASASSSSPNAATGSVPPVAGSEPVAAGGASVAGAGASLGRLIVTATTDDGPATGTNYPLDAVNSIGRDVNNSIVIDDTFVSADHALLTFRGRAWYVEDRGSTNGTWVNGNRVATYLPLGYGDELQIGRIRMRLERARPT